MSNEVASPFRTFPKPNRRAPTHQGRFRAMKPKQLDAALDTRQKVSGPVITPWVVRDIKYALSVLRLRRGYIEFRRTELIGKVLFE